MDSYYKLRQLSCYKLRQVLQRAMDLLQIATGITKCDDYYKLRQYRGLVGFFWGGGSPPKKWLRRGAHPKKTEGGATQNISVHVELT